MLNQSINLDFDDEDSDWIRFRRKDDGKLEKSFDIYDWIDTTLEKAGLIIGGNPPGTAKKVGREIETDLYQSLREKVEEYLKRLKPDITQSEAINEISDMVDIWVNEIETNIDDVFNKLYTMGLAAGMLDSGVVHPAIDLVDKTALEWARSNPHRIGACIKTFANDVVEKFRDIIINSYTPEGDFSLGNLRVQMNKVIPSERYKLERIARTETATVSNMGRLVAWDDDDEKYQYEYHWNSANDNRTKEISKLRSTYNPLSFDECQFLWLHQEQQLSNGRWEADQYNQRCSISRSPIDGELKGNRFTGRELEFRRTL